MMPVGVYHSHNKSVGNLYVLNLFEYVPTKDHKLKHTNNCQQQN